MNVGSLFTGVGGFDLGLERAGHRVVFQCESDPWRRRVLARHWPGVPCHEDVRALDAAAWTSRLSAGRRALGGERHGATLHDSLGGTAGSGRLAGGDGLRDGRRDSAATEGGERPAAAVDLLCGGFPCQDLSVAGRRAGFKGERSSLFFEFARIAGDVVRPGGWVLLENVPGLLSSHDGRDFAVLLATLAELGFHDLAWRVLDSRHFGVPQRRRRVFILARRADGRSACEVLLEPEGGGGDPAAGAEAGARVAASLTSGAHGSGVSAPGRRKEDDVNIVATLQAPNGRGWRVDAEGAAGGHLVASALVTHTLRSEGFDASEDGTGRGTPLVASVSENQRGEVLETPYARQLTSGGGKPGQGFAAARIGSTVRRLSPVETERLQGFPDGWTIPDGPSLAAEPSFPQRIDESCPLPDGPRYAAMGDAVTVPVLKWIGRRLK